MVHVRMSQNKYVHTKGTEKQFGFSKNFGFLPFFKISKKFCAFWVHILILRQSNPYHQKVHELYDRIHTYTVFRRLKETNWAGAGAGGTKSPKRTF